MERVVTCAAVLVEEGPGRAARVAGKASGERSAAAVATRIAVWRLGATRVARARHATAVARASPARRALLAIRARVA